jgi:hypothetical protein
MPVLDSSREGGGRAGRQFCRPQGLEAPCFHIQLSSPAGARAPVDYILVAAPPPVVLAYGIGVDSTALLVELDRAASRPTWS